jgi:hypothetical protein
VILLGTRMMNERIQQLAKQSGIWFVTPREDLLNDFTELIIRECINQAHSVGDLRGANDDMIYGADTAAARISKHFGIKNG